MPNASFPLDLGSSASNVDRIAPGSWTAAWSHIPDGASRRIAPVTSEAQAYYWTRVWQEGERETLAALARGEGHTFGDADAAIRYLLSPDE
jgi:hypothetical protein